MLVLFPVPCAFTSVFPVASICSCLVLGDFFVSMVDSLIFSVFLVHGLLSACGLFCVSGFALYPCSVCGAFVPVCLLCLSTCLVSHMCLGHQVCFPVLMALFPFAFLCAFLNVLPCPNALLLLVSLVSSVSQCLSSWLRCIQSGCKSSHVLPHHDGPCWRWDTPEPCASALVGNSTSVT